MPSTFTLVEQHLGLHRGWSQKHPFVRHVLTSPLEHGRQRENTTLAYRKT